MASPVNARYPARLGRCVFLILALGKIFKILSLSAVRLIASIALRFGAIVGANGTFSIASKKQGESNVEINFFDHTRNATTHNTKEQLKRGTIAEPLSHRDNALA